MADEDDVFNWDIEGDLNVADDGGGGELPTTVAEDVYEEQVVDMEADEADEAIAALGEAFDAEDLSAEEAAAVAAAASEAAAGEDPYEAAVVEVEDEPEAEDAEVAVEDEQAAASRKDMELHLKLHQQAKESEEKRKGKKGGGKDKGKDKGKGKGKGKDNASDSGKGKVKQTGKDKGTGKEKGKGKDSKWGEFVGFIYQEIPATKTLLIKCWKATEEFGGEAVIPSWSNSVEAKVGDKISFDVEDMVQEGEGEPRPLAKNVTIREKGTGNVAKGPPPTDVRTQILYYMSDENLRTDKFFHDSISSSEDGWISTDIFLGCRRIKQLAATTKSIIDGLRDAPGIEVHDTPGEEALRRTTPPPPLEGAIPAAKKGGTIPAAKKEGTIPAAKKEGTIPAAKKSSIAPSAAPNRKIVPSQSSDMYAVGLVANKSAKEPCKFFITCEAVNERYGKDAFFESSQKPASVEIGSLVVFKVPQDAEKGKNPQVTFVAEVAPLGAAVLAASGAGEVTSVGQRKRNADGTLKS